MRIVEPVQGQANSDAMATVTEVVSRIADGDFEVRVPPLGDDPATVKLRGSINRMLDVMDAFVRESVAALASANENVSIGVSWNAG